MEDIEIRIHRLKDYELLFNRYKFKEVTQEYSDVLFAAIEDYYTGESRSLKLKTIYGNEDQLPGMIYKTLSYYMIDDVDHLENTPYLAYEQYLIEENDEIIGADLLLINRYSALKMPLKDIYNEAYGYLKGSECIQNEYYGIKLLKEGCKREDSRCECMLGYCLERGFGIEQDFVKAAHYYELAALHQEVNGMFNYGNCLLEGKGIEINVSEGLRYLEMAAQNGMDKAYIILGNYYLESGNYKEAYHNFYLSKRQENPIGYYFMAYCLENGYGVERDLSKAVDYYMESADNGNSDAMLRLGFLYENGKGVELNYQEALKYYLYAAKAQNYLAYCYLGNLYYEGKGVKKDLEQARKYYLSAADHNVPQAFYDLYWVEKNNNIKRALNYLKKAMDHNFSSAYIHMGKLYQEGINGVVRDENKAFEYYLKAYELGDNHACFWLGYCFEFGIGTNLNYDQAFRFYTMASTQGDPLACNSLGNLYESGHGCNRDLKKAFEYYKMAADYDYPSGIYNLASCLEEGIGCDIDWQQALLYYKKAAGLGSGKAKYHLGLLYEKGKIVEKDLELAFLYYEESAQAYFAPVSVGICYEKGIGCACDLEKAKEYYALAIERHYPRAYYCLGLLYLYHMQDPVGIEYLQKGCQLRDTSSLLFMGELYSKGEWVEKNINEAIACYKMIGTQEANYRIGKLYKESDLNKAIEYFKKAKDHELALFELGLIYTDSKEYTLAVECYLKLLPLKNPYAMNNLGILYENGQGVEADLDKAISLFKQAIALKNSHAAYNLALLYLQEESRLDLDQGSFYIEIAKNLGEEVDELEKLYKEAKLKHQNI